MNTTTSRSASILAVSALAVSMLSACVGPPADEFASSGNNGHSDAERHDGNTVCPVETSDVEGTLRIAHLGSAGPESYILDQGLADACFPNVDVSWTRYPTGPDIVQGFAERSADIGLLGSTPTARALSEPLNLDVIVPEVNSVIGKAEALVAKDAQSIEDLKSGRIGVPFGSTSHYSLLKALQKEGIDPATDVELVNLSPDKLPAAWNSPDLDAAYVWNPTLQILTDDGGTTLRTSEEVGEDGSPTFNLTIADREYTEQNPEILSTWIDLKNWAASQYVENTDEFVESVATVSGLSIEDTRLQLEGLKIIPGEEQSEVLESVATGLFSTAEFLYNEDEIPAVADESHYRDAVVRPEGEQS